MSNNEYLSLLNYVNNRNKFNGEKCLICHFPDKKSKLIELDCKHFFHKRCLGIDNSKYVICPYCEQKTILNKVKNNNLCKSIIKSGVNKGKLCNRKNCKLHKNETEINSNEKKCIFILKSGKNKGSQCNRINCKYHSLNNIIV